MTRVGANTSVTVITSIAGFVTLGPVGAIGGAALGAIAAPIIRFVLHERHKAQDANPGPPNDTPRRSEANGVANMS
jgi:hypothetical protein